eukprot:scaffold1345_cov173-Ochromonas_danica.AAC.8
MSSRFSDFLDQAEVIFSSCQKNDDDDESPREVNNNVPNDDNTSNTSKKNDVALPSLLPLTSEDRASMRRLFRYRKSISVNELKELWRSSSLTKPYTHIDKTMRNKDQISSDHSSTIIIFSICLWITCMSAYAYIVSHRTGDHRVFDN